MVDFYGNQISQGTKLSPKASFMFNMVMKEAVLELDEVPAEFLEKEFAKVTALWCWASTGQLMPNVPMPEGFWDHVGMIPDLALPAQPVVQPVFEPVAEIESGVESGVAE